MRVVLDTNLLVASLINTKSLGFALYRKWREKRFVLLTSEAQIEELRRVTKYDKLQGLIVAGKGGALVNLLRNQAELVQPGTLPNLSPDPDDNLILAIAQEGEADYLASLDLRHVLPFEKLGKTRILHARELLERLG